MCKTILLDRHKYVYYYYHYHLSSREKREVLSEIFSVVGLLLVTRREYSQWLVSYWSHAGYILSVWSPIGHTQGIF
jgi:hypothetical protein